MRRIILYSLFFLISPIAIAAKSVSPMILTADSSEIDFKSGVSEFHGNVHITQQPSELFADYAKIYSDKQRNLKRAVLTGAPPKQARFVTEFGPKHAKIIALANKIIYLPLEISQNGAFLL